jgi:hypothetical protein
MHSSRCWAPSDTMVVYTMLHLLEMQFNCINQSIELILKK